MAIGIILGIIIFVAMAAFFTAAGGALDDGNKKIGGIYLTVAAVLLISFIIAPFSFHTVQTGQIAVVKHFGKATGIKEPGISFDTWFTHKYVKYDTKVREVAIKDAAYSKDAQQMDLDIKFQYQIMPDKVMEITKKYGSLSALESRINAIVIEKTKSSLSGHTAMDIIANRSKMSPNVEKIVKESLGNKYYVNVVSVAITNIDFTDAFEKAVEDKMIAEQKQLKADYEAKAKIVSAEATAKANELLERSLTDKILQEMYINKWDGKLPQVVTDGNMMFQLPN